MVLLQQAGARHALACHVPIPIQSNDVTMPAALHVTMPAVLYSSPPLVQLAQGICHVACHVAPGLALRDAQQVSYFLQLPLHGSHLLIKGRDGPAQQVGVVTTKVSIIFTGGLYASICVMQV
jgi:hypothetical protein